MQLQTKITYGLFFTAFFSVILHNVLYGLFPIGEVVFFLLGLFLIAVFFLFVLYNIITFILKREPQDIWQLGWLGFFSVVLFAGNVIYWYVFLPFFLFFLLKPFDKIKKQKNPKKKRK